MHSIGLTVRTKRSFLVEAYSCLSVEKNENIKLFTRKTEFPSRCALVVLISGKKGVGIGRKERKLLVKIR